MKKSLLLLVAVVLSVAISAQTKKGDIFLSGGTGLTTTFMSVTPVYDGKSGDKTTGSSISFLPSVGYFVINNLAIGLAGNMSHNSSKGESGNKDVSNSIMIVPTAIYFFPVDGKVRPLAQFGVGLVSQTSKYIPKSGSNETNSVSGACINLGGGISYFIKENISFNFGLSYTRVTLTDGDDNKSKIKEGNFAGNIGISIFL
ncbi:MAG: outer membrane beta-barrel protein [Bacteroidota bacterium]